jgi:membrane fusion protein (multidrug efflux system)
MRKAWWLGGLGIVLLAGAVSAALVARQQQNHRQNKPGADVALEFAAREVVTPTLVSMPLEIEFSGPLVAPQTAVVRAKAAGTLLTLAVGEGAGVRAGQSLGTMDLADLGSRIAERQAAVASARAQFVQAERQHGANQRLADQQFISPNALDTSKATLDAAKASLDASLASLNTTKVGLRDAALVAPIAGLVAKRHVVPGEKLAVEQPVLTIVDLATLELAGSVGTHEVARLAPGMPVEVRIEGFDAPVAATLARIAPAAETGSRSIGVTIALANPKERIRAGQYAIAQVVLADPTRRVTLPATALASTGGQEHVWVIVDGTLVRRAVTTGRRDAATGRVEVLSGLAAGAQVLAVRFDNLREGARATVVSKAAPVASAAASAATGSALR